MKVTFNVPALKLAFAQLAAVIARKSQEALYRNVRVFTDAGVVYLQGIDIDSTMTLKIPTATADGEVNVLLDFAYVNAIVTPMLVEQIVLNITGETEAVLSSGKLKRYRLNTFPTAKFLELPVLQSIADKPQTGANTFGLPGLKEQIDQIGFSVPTSEGRHVVASALFEATATDLNLVGTNGLVLSLSTVPLPPGVTAFSFSIPKSALELLSKLEGGEAKTVKISDTEGAYFFETDTELVTYSKTHATFPNYRGIVPASADYPTTVVFNKQAELLSSLATLQACCIVTAEQKERPINFTYDGASNMFLSAVKIDKLPTGDVYTDMGTDGVQVIGTGQAVRTLLDVLKVRPFLERAAFPVTMYIKSAASVVDMHGKGSTPTNPTYRFLVMPMRSVDGAVDSKSTVPMPVVD